jgi:dCMP deaminase
MSYRQRNQKEKQENQDTTNSSFSIEKFNDFINTIKKEHSQENPNRIGWDMYFMELAFLVRKRSPDAQTQHGAVIVDKKNRLISTGYNGFPSGGPDHLIPNVRPHKYDFMIHAEMNAILSSNQDLYNCKMYVTGMPCRSCFLHILGSGIKNVVFGDVSYKESERDLLSKAYLYSLYDMHLWRYDSGSGKKMSFFFHQDLRV